MTQAVPSLPWLVKELRPIPAGGTFFFERRDCQKEDKHNPKSSLASTAHNLYLIWSKIFGEEKWWLRRERKMWVSLLQAGSVLVCKHSIWWQNTVVTLWCRVKIAGTPLYIEVLRLADSRSLSSMQLSGGRNDDRLLPKTFLCLIFRLPPLSITFKRQRFVLLSRWSVCHSWMIGDSLVND